MSKKIFIDGGCSFTYGSELKQRQNSWAHQLHKYLGTTEFLSTARLERTLAMKIQEILSTHGLIYNINL